MKTRKIFSKSSNKENACITDYEVEQVDMGKKIQNNRSELNPTSTCKALSVQVKNW
jgi:hypothetical protein